MCFRCCSISALKEKLDKERLGIILRSDFLSEFFPQTNKFHNGQHFDLYHYNGLARSEIPVGLLTSNCHENSDLLVSLKIRYHHGRAKILDVVDFDLEIINIGGDSADGVDSDSPIVRCLRTKYPRVEIVWDENRIPSIN